MADAINTGMILEALNDKVDRDCRNVDTTSGADAVIEWRNRTEGTSKWYRLYKSGWVEQGGMEQLTSTSYQTVTLEKEMADDKYTINAVYLDANATDTTIRGCNTGYKTTTTFMAKVGVSGSDKYISWEVKGMAATE